MVHLVKYFHHYLYRKRFTMRTDHGSLRLLLNLKNPEGQIARCIEVLSTCDMEIQHRLGSQHKKAYALSSHSCGQCRRKERKAMLSALSNENETNEQQQHDSVPGNESLIELQQNDRDVATVKQLIKRTNRPYANASQKVQQ